MKEEGVTLAIKRKEMIAELIQADPALAIDSAVPHWIAGEVPLQIRKLLEQRISGIGDLEVLGVTPALDAEAYVAPIQRKARFGFDTYEASVYGRLASVGFQRSISMHGVVLEDQVALMDSPIRLIEPGEPLDENKEIAQATHPIDRLLANRNLSPDANYAFAESGDKTYCLHCAGAGGWEGLMASVGQQEGAQNNTAASLSSRAWQTLGTDKKMLLVLVSRSFVIL